MTDDILTFYNYMLMIFLELLMLHVGLPRKKRSDRIRTDGDGDGSCSKCIRYTSIIFDDGDRPTHCPISGLAL
jgi:hypothetical protein